MVYEDVTTVRASNGVFPFFVKRRRADTPPAAERSARWSPPIGTSRLMTSEADCRSYESKSIPY